MSSANVPGEICPKGSPPPRRTAFSVVPGSRKHLALQRRRKFQRHHREYRQWREGGLCASGRVLADRYEEGRARPYDLSAVAYAIEPEVGRAAFRLLGWIRAGELGFGGKRGVILNHRTARRLLRVSTKTAGDAMRMLIATGLVEQCPYFVPRDRPDDHAALEDKSRHRRWLERTPTVRTTAKCHAAIARCSFRGAAKTRTHVVGKKDRPPKSAANPSGIHSYGVRARWPERIFADELRAARKPNAPPRRFAKVIERRPDGSESHGSALSAATLAQRLRTGQLDDRFADVDHGALNAAWSAFEAVDARRGGGRG